MLADLQQSSVSVPFFIPTVERTLTAFGEEVFQSTSTDATTLVVSDVPVQTEVYVGTDQRIEVSVDYAIPYQTGNGTVPAAAPGVYEGAPFFIRHETYTHSPTTGNEVPIASNDELLLATGSLNAPAGTYVTAALGSNLFFAQGTKHITTAFATARMHRFSLMWITEAGDWNNTNVLAGWRVQPWEAGNIPFPTTNPAGPTYTVATDRPQIACINIRFLPYHQSCDCAHPNGEPGPPWLSQLLAADLPDDSVVPWYTL
jgi:hypothetical protein